jgi:chemotaxis protein methyltransferase CheR
MTGQNQLEDIEIRLLLEGVFEQYGYDFREYAPASLKRRIRKYINDERLLTISGAQEKILHDPVCMNRFLQTISVDTTMLFRDPTFYRSFREKVVPELAALKTIRIWHAGCSTGEEVYSIAIILKEEGLLKKTRIYATDMVDTVLKHAKSGIYSMERMQEQTVNYQKSGGKESLSEYYTSKYDNVIFDGSLVKNVVWSQHNLVSDSSFNEFQVVFCRNVLIYFNMRLQNKVIDMIYESLPIGGFLALGAKESLKMSPNETDFEFLDEKARIYKRVR